MPSMEEIEQQLKDLDGIEKLYARKEIKELPNILWRKNCPGIHEQLFWCIGRN